MRSSISQKIFLGAALALAALFPLLASAASTTWTQYEPQTWWYRWTQNDGGYGYAPGLINPTVQISYYAIITDTDTGQVIPPNSSVPVGAHLSLEFVPHQDQDIYWFGTGASNDSPNGEWEPDAAGPPVACNAQDFTGTAPFYVLFLGSLSANIYVPFAVNPPTETLSGTDGMSCGPLETASGGMAAACTVTQTGTLDPVFDFGSTYGIFYYRYTSSAFNEGGSCVGDNTGMTTDPASSGGQYENLFGLQGYATNNVVAPTQVSIPTQSISYPLTVNGSISGPGVSGVTPDTTSCSTDDAPSYTIIGTDSDPNAQIRYGISWDDSGTVEEWAPATGYVAQGTPETVEQAGNGQQFEIMTQDSNGNDSSWVSESSASCGQLQQQLSCSANYTQQTDSSGNPECVLSSCPIGSTLEDGACVYTGSTESGGTGIPAPSIASWRVKPTLVQSGESVTVAWQAQNVTSCSVSGSNGDGTSDGADAGSPGQWNTVSGTTTSSPITGQTIYTITCDGETGSSPAFVTQSTAVNIVPTFEEE